MSFTLTNKFNLPEPLFNAIKYNSYRTGGDISVTTLVDAPQVRILKKKHDIEEDVSEMVWALMGTAIHEILSRANISDVRKRAFILVIDTLKEKAKEIQDNDNSEADKYNRCAHYLFSLLPVFFPELNERYIFEKTVQIEVQGKILAGTFDLYDIQEKRLKDYKICSVYQWIFPEAKKKWFAQTNIYSYLLEQNGYEVKGIDIVAIFRDFSELKKLQNKDYPASQVMEIEVPLHSMEDRQKYISSRMALHIQAENGAQIDCTGKEKWQTLDTFAVMPKPGAKRAIALFDNEDAANKYKLENEHRHVGMYVEKRLGENKRCDSYCSVRNACPQRQRELNQSTTK